MNFEHARLRGGAQEGFDLGLLERVRNLQGLHVFALLREEGIHAARDLFRRLRDEVAIAGKGREFLFLAADATAVTRSKLALQDHLAAFAELQAIAGRRRRLMRKREQRIFRAMPGVGLVVQFDRDEIGLGCGERLEHLHDEIMRESVVPAPDSEIVVRMLAREIAGNGERPARELAERKQSQRFATGVIRNGDQRRHALFRADMLVPETKKVETLIGGKIGMLLERAPDGFCGRQVAIDCKARKRPCVRGHGCNL